MNEAIFIFNITLASKDNGKTNEVVRFQCVCDSYLDALQQVINHCKQADLHAVCIEEDYTAECWGAAQL